MHQQRKRSWKRGLTILLAGGCLLLSFTSGTAEVGTVVWQPVTDVNEAPAFEVPGDVGDDNVYDVQVTVTDNGAPNLSDVQDIAVTVSDAIDAYFIGNSLSWDALQNGAMEDVFQKGGVELNANYHIRCSSSLASTYNNSTDPCVVSGDGAWDTALVSNSYDYLVFQPHEGGTTEEEIAAIDAFSALNPSASLIIYEAYPGFGPAGDLPGFYNQPDQSEFLQSRAEFLQIREAYPDALPVRAMEVLLAFDEMARDGGFVGINSAQDIYRDSGSKRHLNNIGKYLLALTFYSSLTGYDPSLTGLELHHRYEGVTSEQALAIQGLVFDYTNDTPTAAAGDERSIRAGDTVFLDGSDSFDDNTASVD